MFKLSSTALTAACLTLMTPAPAAETAHPRNVDLTGRAFDYRVAGYHICLSFEGEDRLRWLYLAAPNGEAGTTAAETFDRRDVRPDVVMLSWTEATGASVTDVIDLGEMVLHASFVVPGGQRFFSDAAISKRERCPERAP